MEGKKYVDDGRYSMSLVGSTKKLYIKSFPDIALPLFQTFR